jgi:hypothetical protein
VQDITMPGALRLDALTEAFGVGGSRAQACVLFVEGRALTDMVSLMRLPATSDMPATTRATSAGERMTHDVTDALLEHA